jgi:hypothetical protein
LIWRDVGCGGYGRKMEGSGWLVNVVDFIYHVQAKKIYIFTRSAHLCSQFREYIKFAATDKYLLARASNRTR